MKRIKSIKKSAVKWVPNQSLLSESSQSLSSSSSISGEESKHHEELDSSQMVRNGSITPQRLCDIKNHIKLTLMNNN